MKKALHIFSEKKFIDSHISVILKNDYKNYFFYLNNENDYFGRYPELVKFVEKRNYNDLLNYLENESLVFVYYLDLTKAKIINSISKNTIKIYWHFYGAELYNQRKLSKKFISSATRKLLYLGFWPKIKAAVKNRLKDFYFLIRPSKNSQNVIDKAIKRIDYFCWYSIEEYQFLNMLFNNSLPDFLFQPLSNKNLDVLLNPYKKKDLIIGNSRSPYNNHIDIFNLISSLKINLTITLPFNYGSRSNYPEVLIRQIEKYNLEVDIIDDFISKEGYIRLINDHKAFIFNSYRQMGLGNLFIAISCGLKIYMNENNPSFRWLRNNNIKIFSIQSDLKKDLIKNNIKLGKIEQIENIRSYLSLVDSNQTTQ